jgi:CHAD domain-containing protein
MNAARPLAGPYLADKLGAMNDEVAPAVARVFAKSDTEAIHDMRVAIRRLRTALKLVRPIYSRYYADAARAGLTTVHRATSALRDEEVLEETLGDLDVKDETFHEWRRRRKARERSLRRVVLERLRTGELDRALALTRALVALPVRPSRERDLEKFAQKCVQDARAAVESMRFVAVTDIEGLHALRIAYKHLRYTAEIFESVLPADLAALAKPAALFQKRLGEIHDIDVAGDALGRARGLADVTRGRALAALSRAREGSVTKYLEQARPATVPPPTR